MGGPHARGAGGLPSTLDLARSAADEYRREARRRRRRDRLAGRFLAVLALAALTGVGYAGWREFRAGDESAAAPSGIAGAIGGAIGGVTGLDHHRTLSTGVPLGASVTLAEVTVEDVFPTFVRGVAHDVGRADGLEQYRIDVADLAELEPSLTKEWLAVLAALPQGDAVPSLADQPDLTLAIDTDGYAVRRLVVRSAEPPLNVDVSR